MDDRTTITVSDAVWRALNDKKDRGDSFDDVLRRELGLNVPTERDGNSDERELLRRELSGEGELLERRVDGVLAMRDELRQRGTATKADLISVVDKDAVEYASENSIWSNMGKGTLGELDGVESPPSGRSEWRWVGE